MRNSFGCRLRTAVVVACCVLPAQGFAESGSHSPVASFDPHHGATASFRIAQTPPPPTGAPTAPRPAPPTKAPAATPPVPGGAQTKPGPEPRTGPGNQPTAKGPEPAPAGSAGCEPHSPLPKELAGRDANLIVYQQFPPTGPAKTAWVVAFDHAPKRGLVITGAWFQSGPNKPLTKILGLTGLGEIFVPYASGQPRFWDLAQYEFDLVPLQRADAGRCGQLLGRNQTVVRELIEKGVLWRWDVTDQKNRITRSGIYRGHKMTLWASLRADYYQYLISYSFNDDGLIEFRAGATGRTNPQSRTEAHMHNVVWRLRPDFNGKRSHSVSVVRHIGDTVSPPWKSVTQPYNNNREGPLEFQPKEFTTLHVMGGGLTNAAGQHSGYMIMPLYRGVARHLEPQMRQDFWVTRHKDAEVLFGGIQQYADNESIADADVAIWITTSMLHNVRSEDGPGRGAIPVTWVGFDMKPHNLFDGTPLFD